MKAHSQIVIGIPVLSDGRALLNKTLAQTLSNVRDHSGVQFVLVDNGSNPPVAVMEKPKFFNVDVIRNEENKGYFYPLLQLYEEYPKAEIIGLMHYDVEILEPGWEGRIIEAFKKDKKLGLVGIFGWKGVSELGLGNEAVGNLVPDLERDKVFKFKTIKGISPVVIVDSLFMAFRREVIPLLDIREDIPVKHFIDKVWPLRVIESGQRVAVIGINANHYSTGYLRNNNKDEQIKALQESFKKRYGLDLPDWSIDEMARFEGMVAFHKEFKDLKKMVPCKINDRYKVTVFNY